MDKFSRYFGLLGDVDPGARARLDALRNAQDAAQDRTARLVQNLFAEVDALRAEQAKLRVTVAGLLTLLDEAEIVTPGLLTRHTDEGRQALTTAEAADAPHYRASAKAQEQAPSEAKSNHRCVACGWKGPLEAMAYSARGLVCPACEPR